MRYFPLFFDLDDRHVVFVGGDEQIAQKARLVLRSDARATFLAPDLVPELQAHVTSGRAAHVASVYDEALLASADLVFSAAGCVGVDGIAVGGGKRGGAVVNVVDRPALCDVITPALVDRDPVIVAVGTEGAAPVLAREVKTMAEVMLEPDLGRFVERVRTLRPMVAEHVAAKDRRSFWEWVFDGAPRALWQAGDHDGAEAAIVAAARKGGAGLRRGSVYTIALPEAADLLTLRDLRQLQRADLIIHPSDVDARVLELARRDAERLPADGAPPWKTAAETAQDGGQVVVLVPPTVEPPAAITERSLSPASLG
ncbi:MAG: NAD(P)-dependent oxidoreductase [Pseudomonadota bacterium]